MVKKNQEEKAYLTLQFEPEAAKKLEMMAKVEDISKSELIRRAINFYNLKLKARKENQKIILEDEKTGEQTIILL